MEYWQNRTCDMYETCDFKNTDFDNKVYKKISGGGKLSLTLNWADYPSDLDAHMIFYPANFKEKDSKDNKGILLGTDATMAPGALAHAGITGAGISTAADAQEVGQHNRTTQQPSSGSTQAESRPEVVGEDAPGESQKVHHVHWLDTGDAKKPPYMTLDHDDLNGRGPETITIHKMQPGRYQYYVKCFSCSPTPQGEINKQMAESDAVVTVTQGAKQIQRLPLVNSRRTTLDYSVKANAAGNASIIWDVITFAYINGKVNWIPHLKYERHEPNK
jgi:hypothetical protein